MRLQCRALAGAALPAHKDYLGSLMGLELKREALGDIVLPEDQPGTAYVFALEPAAQLICRELFQAGHTELTTELLEPGEVPAFPAAQREMRSATVSSLRNGKRADRGGPGGDQPSPRRQTPRPGV